MHFIEMLKSSAKAEAHSGYSSVRSGQWLWHVLQSGMAVIMGFAFCWQSVHACRNGLLLTFKWHARWFMDQRFHLYLSMDGFDLQWGHRPEAICDSSSARPSKISITMQDLPARTPLLVVARQSDGRFRLNSQPRNGHWQIPCINPSLSIRLIYSDPWRGEMHLDL